MLNPIKPQRLQGNALILLLVSVCLDYLPVGLVDKQNPAVHNGSEGGSAAAPGPVPETSLSAACEARTRHDTRENGAGSVFTFSQFLQDESCVCLCKIPLQRGETVQKRQSLHCHPPKLRLITKGSLRVPAKIPSAFSLEWQAHVSRWPRICFCCLDNTTGYVLHHYYARWWIAPSKVCLVFIKANIFLLVLLQVRGTKRWWWHSNKVWRKEELWSFTRRSWSWSNLQPRGEQISQS